MSEWAAKRFWKEVTVGSGASGWHILLDARQVRTPAKAPLDLPSEAMAKVVAQEWAAQGEIIDPRTMPVTRSANSAIDRVTPQHAEVAQMLAAYAETDLLCHRAETPERLIALQSKGWDPILDWAADRFGARLIPTAGILPATQGDDALARLGDAVGQSDAFQLTALHDLVALSGSLILGLAVAHGRLDPAEAWALSRIDEEWQIAQWGRDEEADATAAFKFSEFEHAHRFWNLAATSP